MTDVAKYYEELLQTNRSDTDIRLAVAFAQREVVKDALFLNASGTQGVELYRRSLALLDELVRQYPENDQYAFELARTLRELAEFVGTQGAAEEAIGHCRRAIATMERIVDKSPAGNDSYHHLLNWCRRTLATRLIYAGAIQRRSKSNC